MPLFHTITHYITHTSRLRVIEYGTSSSYKRVTGSRYLSTFARTSLLSTSNRISHPSPPFAPTPCVISLPVNSIYNVVVSVLIKNGSAEGHFSGPPPRQAAANAHIDTSSAPYHSPLTDSDISYYYYPPSSSLSDHSKRSVTSALGSIADIICSVCSANCEGVCESEPSIPSPPLLLLGPAASAVGVKAPSLLEPAPPPLPIPHSSSTWGGRKARRGGIPLVVVAPSVGAMAAAADGGGAVDGALVVYDVFAAEGAFIVVGSLFVVLLIMMEV